MGKELIKVGIPWRALAGGLIYLWLCVAMLYVVWQDFIGDRVFLLPGRGDSQDIYLYWHDSPYLCFLVVMVWLACALLLLAGLATLLVATWRQRKR